MQERQRVFKQHSVIEPNQSVAEVLSRDGVETIEGDSPFHWLLLDGRLNEVSCHEFTGPWVKREPE